MASIADVFKIPPLPESIGSLLTIIQNITGIAAGGLPSWIVTGILFLVAAGIAIWAKGWYNKWTNAANQQRQDQDISTLPGANQDASDKAGTAAADINQAAAAADDSGKPPIPPAS